MTGTVEIKPEFPHAGETVQGLEQVELPDTLPAVDDPISPTLVHNKGKQIILIDGKNDDAPYIDEKQGSEVESGRIPEEKEELISTARDLVTKVISLDDDPSLPIFTFRFWFLGLGLSIFGSVLGQIYYFKPQTLSVSSLFLEIISYVIGIFMAKIIPKHGYFKYLNPGPFNIKEHTAIVIMSSTASGSALGIELLAVDRLFYNNVAPNTATSIFTLLSSQLLGYGFAGILRSVLVYPTYALYPGTLPQISLFEALNKHAGLNSKRLRVFWITFTILFFWEIIPEYMFPLLTGISIFCIAQAGNPNPVFTNIFGGASGNEGLGLFSISLDWQYVSSAAGPFFTPLQTQVNQWIGFILCYATFAGVYYSNVWNAKSFQFLAQDLFLINGSVYNQSIILDNNNELNRTAYEEYGQPYFATTWAVQLLTNNLAITATITHMLLWHWNDLKAAFDWRGNRKIEDPHYSIMQNYKETPVYWYAAILLGSFIIAQATNYVGHSGLPWWSLIVALILSIFFTIFCGLLFAITGFGVNIQPVIQMIGGFMHPGKPIANMYFTLYGYNSEAQALWMLRDLKLGQYIKLPPRATFVSQMIGTVIGAVFNYIIMDEIITNQADILRDPIGSNIWSGQQPQNYNSQAISWGALGKQMFGIGSTYYMIPLAFVIGLFAPIPFWLIHKFYPKLRADYIITPIICWFIGNLSVGINSSVLMTVLIGIFSQYYLRRYRRGFFRKYNYVISAGLDGGTQVIVFIMTFAFFGASGKPIYFPTWWGNPNPQLQVDPNTGLTMANDRCYYFN